MMILLDPWILTKVSLFGTIMSFLWLELILDRPVDAAIAFTVGGEKLNVERGKWKLVFVLGRVVEIQL